MKHITFKGANAYTCLAIMLEDFKINKTDQDIVMDMRMPYLFTKNDISQTKTAFIAGTRLQGKQWYDLFLNRDDLEFVEEHLTRLQSIIMLQKLGKVKRKALLTLIMDKKTYTAVFKSHHVLSDIYAFILPETIESTAYRTVEFDEETLLKHLDTHVHIGFINPSDEKSYSIVDAVKDSLNVIDEYLVYVQEWCQMKHTKKRQLEAFDMVFRAFIVDVRRILKLKGEETLYRMIRRVSHKYVDMIKNPNERFMIPLADDFKLAITQYRNFVADYLKHIEHTLKY